MTIARTVPISCTCDQFDVEGGVRVPSMGVEGDGLYPMLARVGAAEKGSSVQVDISGLSSGMQRFRIERTIEAVDEGMERAAFSVDNATAWGYRGPASRAHSSSG